MYVNPYESISAENGTWLKSNFHVHVLPPGSGKLELPDVVEMYKEAGYDVLTISNQRSFLDASEMSERFDITMINGIEYIEQDGILCIGVNEFIEGSPQEAIDRCVELGGFSVLCHPNWQTEDWLPPKLTLETMRNLKGYIGIELITPGIFYRFKGSGYATDVWDEFLTAGKLVWGFANDDFHKYYNFDRAWNVISSSSRNYEDIKAAVHRGSLYASTGLTLTHFSFAEGTIRVSANLIGTPDKVIRFHFIGKGGTTLHECKGETGEYHMTGNEIYVRVEASSEHGAMLWTQPIYDSEKLKYV